MIHTIRVTTREASDPLGRDVLVEIQRTLGLADIERIRTVKVYRLEGLTAEEAERLARAVLAEDVDQRWSLDAPLVEHADRVVEVAYLPGVMNPEAASILKAAADLGIGLRAADSSREYAFYGRLDEGSVDQVLARLLVNPTIERVVEREPESLLIEGRPGPTARIPIRAMDDAALMALAGKGLYLELDEMQAIRDYFEELDRDPTDLELEVLAQTWSEHCVHKTFRSQLRIDGVEKPSMMQRLKQTALRYDALVLSAFVDNSGVLAFYEGWAVCGKVETHNSPSAIEPYGGAMTGSGGVFRDIMGTGQGAAVVASTDMFCFAPPDLPAGELPPGCLPPDYLLRRVVAGVRDYGNRMGIPTNNGSVHFHPDFRAKPTVIVGAYGLLPETRAPKGSPRAGDRILALGGRTGRDGIHGATFSSAEMTAETITVNSQAVQIGNAVEEKRVLDAVLACRDADLIRAITDCGAGGFSSAIGEMGEPIGASVELDRAPLKYSGLAPWEIFVSESQERMVMAVAPEDVARVEAICATYNVEVSDLGVFEPSGKLVVRYAGEVVGELDMRFLHDGYPERRLEGRFATNPGPVELPPAPADAAAWLAACRAVLAHPNVASKEPIVRQYDHTVQGTNALPPFGGAEGDAPGDAVVLTPLLGKPYGLVIAHGLNPVLNTFDAYWGSVWAAAEAISNLVAVGGNPREVGLIDNFIWPKPDAPSLGELDRAVDACVDVMHALGRPFVSGKDSLSSSYRYPDGSLLKIPPVLCVSVFGRIPDVARTVSSDFKAPGSRLLLVGARDLAGEGAGMGGSVYLETAGLRGHLPPKVDLAVLPRTLDAVHAAIHAGEVLACHDVSEGGLLTALAEMGFGGDLGAEIVADRLGARPDLALFNETAGVFVIELAASAEPRERFAGLPWIEIGWTLEEPLLRLSQAGETTARFEIALAELQAAWEAPMREVFH
ncbi:MAG: phosphoribosylformylglycinamidine synthase [Caldilineae bacterium]|nr:phosphoribosylformylglycinamidine synthase [Caldilineae bacterium]